MRRKDWGSWKNIPDQETPTGRIGNYVSPDAKVGALVELRCRTCEVADSTLFQTFLLEIATVVAQTDPTYVSFADIPQSVMEHEIANHRASQIELGKPGHIATLIAEYQAATRLLSDCLMEQFLAPELYQTVAHRTKELIAETGEFIRVGGFLRYEVGGQD